MRYLVLFDANKIKEYVFATGRLKEIRGASEQVRQLTEQVPIQEMFQALFNRTLPNIVAEGKEGLIYAGGGAGALLLNNEADANTFCRELERRYWHETRSATLSAVYVPVEDDSCENVHQAESIAQEQAARTLAQRKSSVRSATHLVGGGYIRFCNSDRCYPASIPTARREGDGRVELLSVSSKNKRELSHDYRSSLKHTAFWDEFVALKAQDADDWEEAIQESQDLTTIGNQSTPHGYVALVYADGDSIGSLIKHVVKTYGFAGYRRLSTALVDAATTGTAQALHEAYPNIPRFQLTEQGREERFLPFEVITIGGDDVILVCTAEQGLQVACTLSRVFTHMINGQLNDFEQAYGVALKDDRQNPIHSSLSVGVVIAHASHPILNLVERGKELLKQAKHGRHMCERKDEGWIDFHIVSTPGLQPIKEIRAQHYAPSAKSSVSFTARPYRCSQMEQVIRHARIFQTEISGSKRSQLYDECMQASDRTAATFALLRIQARMGFQGTKILDALHDLGVGIHYPFMDSIRDPQRLVTPLVDLIEVAEFVGKDGTP